MVQSCAVGNVPEYEARFQFILYHLKAIALSPLKIIIKPYNDFYCENDDMMKASPLRI